MLAFYSRSDASVTIVETNLGEVDDETAVFVLSHEFVHAQQDVDVGLQGFFDAHVTTTDSNTAIRSVTEGEAVLFSNTTMARQPGLSLTASVFDAYYAQQQQGLRDAAAGVTEPGVPAAAFTDLSSSFPYPRGHPLAQKPNPSEGEQPLLNGTHTRSPGQRFHRSQYDEQQPTSVVAEQLSTSWSNTQKLWLPQLFTV